MSRLRSLAILVLVVVLAAAGLLITRTESSAQGCPGVREVHERASFIEDGNDVPTSEVYAGAATAARVATVEAPLAVTQELQRLADAYEQLATMLEGFRPDDPSTYHLYEENTAAIEAAQSEVDAALPAVGGWLDDRCA